MRKEDERPSLLLSFKSMMYCNECRCSRAGIIRATTMPHIPASCKLTVKSVTKALKKTGGNAAISLQAIVVARWSFLWEASIPRTLETNVFDSGKHACKLFPSVLAINGKTDKVSSAGNKVISVDINKAEYLPVPDSPHANPEKFKLIDSLMLDPK